MVVLHQGDSGKTWGKAGVPRVLKNHPIVEFYGTSDELISAILLFKTTYLRDCKSCHLLLDKSVKLLYQINAYLATGKDFKIKPYIKFLDNIEKKNRQKLSSFVLDFSSKEGAALNYLRALARRVERRLYDIPNLKEHSKAALLQKALNRLSTAFFWCALAIESQRACKT